MKRILLHILFWFCYLLQFALIEFLWAKAAVPQLPHNELIPAVIQASLLYLFPQVIFSYYLSFYAVNKIVKRKGPIVFNILEILAMLFICIVIDRAITNYIVLPVMYHNLINKAPLLEPQRAFVAVLYLSYASGLMITIKSVRNQLAAKEREKNLIKEKLETELKFLRNQTSPHFLLNTLNNIYALARKKSDDTAEVVMRLSELLRFMLYETGRNLISLSDEIKVLEDYLELEMLRYNNRLSVCFNKEIDTESYQITPLLLLPFVENAFKHGISETRFESFVRINIRVKKGYLNFEIENTNESHCNDTQKSNIGLVNARRQLELTYSEYHLDVENGNETFKVNLSINLNSHVEI
ncbi:MAG TPA: histidine kinase [Chitinophagaceae bacterium]|nr:histidine kinase [Chitinophagaceae bacterium]